MNTWKSYKRELSQMSAKRMIHPQGDVPENYEEHGKMDAKEITLKILDGYDWGGLSPQDAKILEYGCGDGRILRYLPFSSKFGVDLIEDFIDVGKTMCHLSEKEYPLDPSNLHTLDSLKEKNFDIVFAYSVFIHLNDIDTMKALRYINDRMKIGAFAFLQVPIYQKHTQPVDFLDVRTWLMTTFIDAVRLLGFEPVKLFSNRGEFSYDKEGINHRELQVLQKVS